MAEGATTGAATAPGDRLSDGLSDRRPEDTMRISVRLDPEHAEKLQRLARRTGQTTSETVKRAIDVYDEREAEPSERPYDLLLRSGFIGGGASGDPDFSTNYKQYLFRERDSEHGDR
jgi:hypothetical protein